MSCFIVKMTRVLVISTLVLACKSALSFFPLSMGVLLLHVLLGFVCLLAWYGWVQATPRLRWAQSTAL
jgi:hypothetical protein